MNHIPGSDGFGCLEQRSEDRLVGADFIAGHVSYDGPEAQLFEVVLLLEFAVNCNENVKRVLSVHQQSTVVAAATANLADRRSSVAGECSLHLGVHAFVEEDTHASKLSLASSINRMACSRLTEGKPRKKSSSVEFPSM
jgi:hypothetical protein